MTWAFCRTVDVGGVGVVVDARTAVGAAALAEVVASLPDHEGVPAVRFAIVDDLPPAPGRPCDLEAAGVEIWWEGGEVVLASGAGVARVGATDTCAGGATDVAAIRHFFQLAVMHMLASAGRYVLHSAAITGPAGAFLVLGSTGSGKSTTAAGAHAAGWDVLGDDLVIVRDADDGVEVAGLPRPLAVPGDVADGGDEIAGDPRGRRRLPHTVLARGWYTVAGTVSIVRSDAEGSIVHRAGPDALRELIRSTFLVGDRELLAAFFPTAATLSRLPAWKLALARDPSARLAEIGRDLEVLRAGGQPPTTSPASRS